MNVVWVPPVDTHDLDQLSALLSAKPPIVSTLPDFGSGEWREFFHEHVRHGTEFFAHLDANFLSQLLRVFTPGQLPLPTRQAAALMCLAITFDIKVNPTFATHEYAFTGSDDPDSRLAAFYFLDNLPPQQLADMALGRKSGLLPEPSTLPRTKHGNRHQERLRMWGLTYTSLLKIVELHCCTPRLSGKHDIATRHARASTLLDWMYGEFLFCGSLLVVADQLWGSRRMKTVLKGIDHCDRDTVLPMCQNAAWDLVLAENWAESEGKREPGDPFHLVFTFDKALRQVAGELLVKPSEAGLDPEQWVHRKYERSWPQAMADSLAKRYLSYQANLDSPKRRWLQKTRPTNEEFVGNMERIVREQLSLAERSP
jgi:hypothetical protein